MVTRISQSESSTFRECRRKWWLGTYRGLQSRQVRLTGPLALGTRLHNALELYYTADADLLETHALLVQQDRDRLVLEGQLETDLDKEAELGRVMLDGYLEWLTETGADNNTEVISAEEVLSVPLLDGAVEMVGKLDMRVRRELDGVRLFVDHKTAANISDITKIAAISEQFLQYHLLENLKEGEETRCDGGVYNILRKSKRTATAKGPFYHREEVRHNRLQLDSYWRRFHGIVRDILHTRAELDAGGDPMYWAYPTPTKDCSWKCPFYSVCPLFDDGSAAEEMLDMYYTEGDPYARYDERNAA